jgi:hypothetical protein
MEQKRMSLKTKWIFAVLALGVVIACMKAGDGVGLDASGKVCTADSRDSLCIAYIDPCIANPSGPGCPVDCKKTPTAAGCPIDSCTANPALCAVVHCAATPTAKVCVDSCTLNPALSWCAVKVNCTATPTAQVCIDSCAVNPALGYCGPPKTKFSEVYAVITGSTCLTCHIPGGPGVLQGKLNMASSDTAYANLVGALVADQTLAPGFLRVKAGSPDSSMLMIKVNAGYFGNTPKLPNNTSYYSAMPMTGAPLTKAKIDLIKKWITDGALK